MMKTKDIRYYIWVCSMVFGCAGFYTVIIVGGVKQFISVDSSLFQMIQIVAFLIMSVCGLFFYIPRLRNVWLGGTMEEKYLSLPGSWIGIVLGSATGTMIFLPQVKKIQVVSHVPVVLMAAMLFFFFALILMVVSFRNKASRRAR